MRGSRYLLAASLLLATAEQSAAAPNEPITPELQAAYRAVLADPTNLQANLEYARIAELLGQDRKALTSYERILMNHPGNRDAEIGLQRIRRKMQPAFTKFTVTTGIAVESNPRHLSSGAETDVVGKASLTMRDERMNFDHRWRTDIRAGGEIYGSNQDLNYGYFGGTVGPVLDILPKIAAHPFVGGSVASLDGDFYYGETTFGVTFEGRLNGAYQSARVRGGYRQYGSSFSSDDGFFADVTSKWSHPFVFNDHDVFMIESLGRWSDIDGTGFNVSGAEVEPGKYLQTQTELSYYNKVHEWLTLGVGVTFGHMFYAEDLAPSGKHRHDVKVSPELSATFNNIFGHRADLRFEYRYEWNDSNDPAKDYDNQIGSARVVHRF